MSREILFRGKRSDNGEWVYGYYVEYPLGYVYIQNSQGDMFAVYSETVGQFTGFLDKNGVKIFEGDILVCKAAGDFDYWLIDNICYEKNLTIFAEFYTIAGNKYDNSELLEVKV